MFIAPVLEYLLRDNARKARTAGSPYPKFPLLFCLDVCMIGNDAANMVARTLPQPNDGTLVDDEHTPRLPIPKPVHKEYQV